MKVLHKSNKSITSILGNQKIDKTQDYRLMYYVVKIKEDNNYILFNNLNKSIVVLEDSENAIVDNLNTKCINFDNDTVIWLIENWYLVPHNFNEKKTFDEMYSILKVIKNSKEESKNNSFVILPTTQCNARCYYCYEEGCKKIAMNEKSSNDVANYIIKRAKKEKKVKIQWFGGEPLLGEKSIDKIVEVLKQNDMEIYSSMISNGYLFDTKLIKKAINSWKLQNIQITLDGTKDIYNQTKAYVYNDAKIDPFTRVVDNIEELVNNNVFVNIRLNLSQNNKKDIESLILFLSDRFKDIKNKKDKNNKYYLNIYCWTLFQESGENLLTSDEDVYARELKVKDMLYENSLAHGYSLPFEVKLNFCMSDHGLPSVILPDGSLHVCEHFDYNTTHTGFIYDEKQNEDVIKSWRNYLPAQKECYSCTNYPSCLRLKRCPNIIVNCFDNYKNFKENELKKALSFYYKKKKEKSKN